MERARMRKTGYCFEFWLPPAETGGRSNLDAHIGRAPPEGGATEVRMLLSFQRPARLAWRGLLRMTLPGGASPPERTVKSSASDRGLNPPSGSPRSTAAGHCSRASGRPQPPEPALSDLQHAAVEGRDREV